MDRYPIVDAHEDLAFNGLLYARDYRRSAYAIREDEHRAGAADRRGRCMLGVPELLQANVAMVFATLYTLPQSRAEKGEPGYRTQAEAREAALRQFGLYEQWLAEDPRLGWVRCRDELTALREDQAEGAERIGVVLLIENADCLVSPDEVEEWYARGVRIIGPAWHRNAYTGSSGEPAPLTAAGEQLIAAIEQAGIGLDISHMSDEAMRRTFERYAGPICSSHANPRAMVDQPRQLPGWALAEIGQRDGVAGIMPVNWALDSSWKQGDGKDAVSLRRVVEAVQTTAKLAGGYRYVGLGTDFDGGFGAESCPRELETIADLPRLAPLLVEAGIEPETIAGVMGGNWMRWLHTVLPEGPAAGGTGEEAAERRSGP